MCMYTSARRLVTCGGVDRQVVPTAVAGTEEDLEGGKQDKFRTFFDEENSEEEPKSLLCGSVSDKVFWTRRGTC